MSRGRLVAFVCAGLSLLVWLDVAARARRAYLEGERCLAWHARPELQRAHWDARLKDRERDIDARVAAGEIAPEDARIQRELARAERDERVAESPLKYAVRWFETGADLFSTPPNPWTARTRARLQEARALWDGESAARGLDPRDYSYR